MPKVFSLPIFTKEFRRSIPSVILWFLISGGYWSWLIFLFGRSSNRFRRPAAGDSVRLSRRAFSGVPTG